MTTQTTTTVQTPAVSVAASNRVAAFSAILLGTAMIFLVGFAPISAVHNAAHDTRHSAAFPCH